MGQIEGQLTNEIDHYRRLARNNYRAAYGLSAVAVLASIIAGLSVAADWFSRTTLAILSALPGGVLVLSEKFKFEERSTWHWKKTYALKSLLYQLQFEGKPDADVSAQWRKLKDDLEPLWPGLGKGPKDPETP